MIPVLEVAEPASFDASVRRPGLNWLSNHNVPPSAKLPKGVKLQSYWRTTLGELHSSYDGICAYLSIYIERCTGAVTADHFVAKSSSLALAYEWSNYRLACTTLNARKNKFSLALDPFEIQGETFHLELVSGRIFPNPLLDPVQNDRAQKTIALLKLDDGLCREARARRYSEYCSGDISAAFLQRYAPFVWFEADRQGLI